jgi:hypothetical protein
VKAKTEEEAHALILAGTSQYGGYDNETLYQFISERKMDWMDVKEWAQFPQVNMGTLEVGWFDKSWQPEEPKEAAEGDGRLGGEPSSVKQINLILHADDYGDFIENARALGETWELDTVTDIVVRAVKFAMERSEDDKK